MNKSESILRLAVPALLALTGTAFTANAVPDDSDTEQCAGIAKAGEGRPLCIAMTSQVTNTRALAN